MRRRRRLRRFRRRERGVRCHLGKKKLLQGAERRAQSQKWGRDALKREAVCHSCRVKPGEGIVFRGSSGAYG